MAKRELPRVTQNKITAFGAIVALVTLLAIIIMMLADMLQSESNPYFGIMTYIIMPSVLVLGLLLIPIGMWRAWRRRRRGEDISKPWPIVDLNQKSQRNATRIFLVGTTLFLLLSSLGVYEAYHYSESVEFCGEVCHDVMEPQYTAYQDSPHARVPCTACHVGEGAEWYAKSKLSGAYQVYAVTVNNYPHPIPTPIENLRPARETCERCHWPEKHYGGTMREFVHHRYDEENSPWHLEMQIKTSGSLAEGPHSSGIHWHINEDVTVEYIARDEKRQDIPWVRYTDKRSGESVVYQNVDDPLEPEVIDTAEVRRMDCLDCHNRPSHVFHSPDYAVDQLLTRGQVARDLPSIKAVAVEAMAEDYDSDEEAFTAIDQMISAHYSENYPDLAAAKAGEIKQAIASVQSAFSRNIFPYMKARWSAYPNNIGHFEDVGCMRCHLGNHESDAGQKITHDCSACHTIVAQGPEGEMERATTKAGLEFKHPEDIDEAWREWGCYECHSGTQP